MPWEHCERTIPDTEVCPACGVTKEAWTVEFAATRNFRVARAPAAKVLVVDAATDDPLPGVAWRITLADGATHEGETDELGYAKVRAPAEGQFRLALPTLAPAALVELDPPPEAREDPADGGPPVFTCATARRVRVRVAAGFELALEEDGRPLAGVAWRLELGDDALEGAADDDGVLRAALPAGAHEGWLVLRPGAPDARRLHLRFDDLADDVLGAQRRLNNLGLGAGKEDGDAGPLTRAALEAFQRREGLACSGELDEATRARLVARHGS